MAWDGQRSLSRHCPFCWCACVFVRRRVGWVGIIRHQMLLWQQSISNPHLSRSFALLWNIPCPFLDIFVLNKATTIVLNRISSLRMVWFSHINICVVTKQLRDKTTRKVNQWPVTKATLPFSLLKFAGSSCEPIIYIHICENQCVYSWTLKIYQVFTIFLNKTNTYRLRRWNVWTTCKAVNFFSNIACVKIFNSDISFTSTSTFIKLVNSVQKSHQPTRAHSEKTIWRLGIIL